jgi:hypothetical protein
MLAVTAHVRKRASLISAAKLRGARDVIGSAQITRESL